MRHRAFVISKEAEIAAARVRSSRTGRWIDHIQLTTVGGVKNEVMGCEPL